MAPAELPPERSVLRDLLRNPVFLGGVALAVWAGFFGYWAFRGSFNADEGFYALAAKRVSEGLIPYRDFGYTQMPLLPFLNVPWHALFGYTIQGGRMASFVWLMFGGLLILSGGRRLGGGAAGAAALVLLVATGLPAGFFLSIGKTYAAASAFLLAAAWALIARVPVRMAWWWIVAAGTIAVGVRLTVAPCVLLLWCGFVAVHWRTLRWIDLSALLAVPAVMLGSFYWMAPGNALFWTLGYHLQTVLGKHSAEFWFECFLFLGGLFPLSAAAYFRAWRARQASDTIPILILTSGWGGIFASIALAGIYGEYLVPYLGLVVLGACSVLWQSASVRFRAMTILAALAAVACAYTAEYFRNSSFHDQLATRADWADLRAATEFLASRTSPEARIAGSMVEVPLQAHRTVDAGFELGKFSLTVSLPEAQAAELHLLHWNELLRRAESAECEAWVMSTSRNWSLGWSVPRITLIPASQYQQFVNVLLRHYEVSLVNPTYVILLRKPSAPPAPAKPAP